MAHVPCQIDRSIPDPALTGSIGIFGSSKWKLHAALAPGRASSRSWRANWSPAPDEVGRSAVEAASSGGVLISYRVSHRFRRAKCRQSGEATGQAAGQAERGSDEQWPAGVPELTADLGG